MFWRKKRPLSDFQAEIESHLAHEAEELLHRQVELLVREIGRMLRAIGGCQPVNTQSLQLVSRAPRHARLLLPRCGNNSAARLV